MNKLNGAVLLFLGFVLASKSASANVDVTIEQSLSDITKGNIASAIVLSDAGLVTLGVVNFDPNNIVDLDGLDAGSPESVQRRKELNVYSIPWESDWIGEPDNLQTASFVKFSYINSKQSLKISDQENQIDKLSEKSYLLFAEQRWRYQLNQDWQLQFGLGAHFVWYDNDFDYSDDVAVYRDLLDGSLFNTSYGAWMIDPSIQFHYQNTLWGNKWQYMSRFSYAFGDIIKTDTDLQSGSPKVSRFSNTFIYHYPLPELMAYKNEMRFLFKRIDLSGDAVDTMGTSHYYETGLGWIVATPSLSSWLTNIGIGVTVNIDSSLSGGSVVLLFNEDI